MQIGREKGRERERERGADRERQRESARESERERASVSQPLIERWGAGVETQKNVRGEVGGWG